MIDSNNVTGECMIDINYESQSEVQQKVKNSKIETISGSTLLFEQPFSQDLFRVLGQIDTDFLLNPPTPKNNKYENIEE